MAPRGQKRTATENKKATAAKKSRADTTEENAMTKLVETLQAAETLPASCCSMLVTGVRGSLDTPADERHEVQSTIVSMVDEVVQAEDVRLQGVLSAAEANVAKAEATRLELAAKFAETEAFVAEKVKVLDEKTSSNTEALKKVSEADSLLAEKKSLQEEGDKAMAELQNDKTAVQTASNNDLKAIQEGQANCKTLLALLEKLSCDESLIKALPATCGRTAPERGDFDGMVVKQLESSLAQKLIELTKAVDEETVAAKARADAVSDAQGQSQVATELQGKTAEEQANAKTLLEEASAAMDMSQQGMKSHETTERDVVSKRDEEQTALDTFRQSVRTPFEALRDAKAASAPAEIVSDKMATTADEAAVQVEVGGA